MCKPRGCGWLCASLGGVGMCKPRGVVMCKPRVCGYV